MVSYIVAGPDSVLGPICYGPGAVEGQDVEDNPEAVIGPDAVREPIAVLNPVSVVVPEAVGVKPWRV